MCNPVTLLHSHFHICDILSMATHRPSSRNLWERAPSYNYFTGSSFSESTQGQERNFVFPHCLGSRSAIHTCRFPSSLALHILDKPWPSSAAHYNDIPSHGSEPPSREKANIRQFGLAASTSNGDCSRLINTIWLLPTTLRGLRKRRIFGLFAGLRQQAPSPSARKIAESHRHAPGMIGPTKAMGEPDLDVLERDTVDVPEIFLSTDDAQFETGTHPIPLIILSLPSSEDLVEDPSLPVSMDEDLLSPDGTFRPSGRLARVAVQTYDITDATRLALASRLRHRQKRDISFPSPDVLTSPSVVRWPRWL